LKRASLSELKFLQVQITQT